MRAGLVARLGATGVAILAGSLLGTAAMLEPASQGHGTHEQLGLPACMWALQFDAPCMTCGMTTSFTHAAEGHLIQSFLVQPMGLCLAVMTAAGFWIAVYIALTGSRIGERLARLLNGRTLAVFAILGGAAWVYKIVTWNAQA